MILNLMAKVHAREGRGTNTQLEEDFSRLTETYLLRVKSSEADSPE